VEAVDADELDKLRALDTQVMDQGVAETNEALNILKEEVTPPICASDVNQQVAILHLDILYFPIDSCSLIEVLRIQCRAHLCLGQLN
jgi:hypothetical protein